MALRRRKARAFRAVAMGNVAAPSLKLSSLTLSPHGDHPRDVGTPVFLTQGVVDGMRGAQNRDEAGDGVSDKLR